MKLETFEHPFDDNIKALGWYPPFTAYRPGTWVKHRTREGSMGILVANVDAAYVVLWSAVGQSKPLKYDPLAIDEDIFIPIRHPRKANEP